MSQNNPDRDFTRSNTSEPLPKVEATPEPITPEKAEEARAKHKDTGLSRLEAERLARGMK